MLIQPYFFLLEVVTLVCACLRKILLSKESRKKRSESVVSFALKILIILKRVSFEYFEYIENED